MPYRYDWESGREVWYNSQRTIENFQHSPNKRQSAYKADIWEDHDAGKWKIAEMGIAQLRIAIQQLTDGWKCYGQQAKIVSLRKALEKLSVGA